MEKERLRYYWPDPELTLQAIEKAETIERVEFDPIINETGEVYGETIRLVFENGAGVSITQTPTHRGLILKSPQEIDTHIIFANKNTGIQAAEARILNPFYPGRLPRYESVPLNPDDTWQTLGKLMEEAKRLVSRFKEGTVSSEEVQTFAQSLRQKIDGMIKQTQREAWLLVLRQLAKSKEKSLPNSVEKALKRLREALQTYIGDSASEKN